MRLKMENINSALNRSKSLGYNKSFDLHESILKFCYKKLHYVGLNRRDKT